MSLTQGTRLVPYEIVAALGAGGMGQLYHGRHLADVVLIKELK